MDICIICWQILRNFPDTSDTEQIASIRYSLHVFSSFTNGDRGPMAASPSVAASHRQPSGGLRTAPAAADLQIKQHWMPQLGVTGFRCYFSVTKLTKLIKNLLMLLISPLPACVRAGHPRRPIGILPIGIGAPYPGSICAYPADPLRWSLRQILLQSSESAILLKVLKASN